MATVRTFLRTGRPLFMPNTKMPTPHFLGFVAAVGLGLLTFHLVQANREQRHAVKASTSPNSRTRKDEEGDDRGDASGVNVRGGDSSIQRRGDNHREYCAEKNDLDAREYSYEVRKLHELFPAATLNTCRSIFEANKGNMDECIDFLLKHHDNLDNARDSKVLPVSDDTVAEKMPEMIQLDSKVTPTAEVDLKATHNREELLSELSYLNALEQEIERKKTALREEEYALQALQIRIEGMKSDDNGSLSLEQVHDSEGPTKDNAEVKVTEVGSAQGAHVLGQVALSMVLPMPEALTKEFAISELSMSDVAVSRAISKGSVCEPESASCYSEQTIDSPNQEDDDHRSESSWSDLGAGSIGADEH